MQKTEINGFLPKLISLKREFNEVFVTSAGAALFPKLKLEDIFSILEILI